VCVCVCVCACVMADRQVVVDNVLCFLISRFNKYGINY